jgi:hypothetical protein
LGGVTALKTLELLAFPKCLAKALVPFCKCGCEARPTDGMEEFSDATVNRVFTRAANKVIQTLGPCCPGLTVLLFRAQDVELVGEGHEPYDHLYAFIRSLKIDESGHATYEAVPVEPHMLKHYETRSDILEMDDRRITTNAKTRARNACQYSKNRVWFRGSLG